MVEHFVPFEQLPSGFTVPPELADRFGFDESRRRLVFRGFMSKADFDRLTGLAEDWSYRRAIDELFQLCTPEDETEAPRRRGILGRLASVVGLY